MTRIKGLLLGLVCLVVPMYGARDYAEVDVSFTGGVGTAYLDGNQGAKFFLAVGEITNLQVTYNVPAYAGDTSAFKLYCLVVPGHFENVHYDCIERRAITRT